MKKLYSLFAAVVLAVTVSAQSSYKLVTSASDLQAGGVYLIASGKSGSVKVMGYQATTNRPESTSASTVDANGVISLTPASAATDNTSAYEVTLGGSDGAWVLNDAVNATVLGPDTAGNKNALRANATATFTIAITATTYQATMTGTPNNSRGLLRYNSGSSLFACYSTGQSDVYLFRKLPAITTQPTDKTVTVPATATFSATITGDNLTYQWKSQRITEQTGQMFRVQKVAE